MAETLKIEIPIETVDETSAGIAAAINSLNKLNKAIMNSQEQTEKSRKSVSKFDEQAQKTEKSLARWAKEKYEIFLGLKDHLSPMLSTMKNGLKNFVGKTWSVTMKAIDLVTSPIRGIINLLKNPIFQAGAVLGISIGMKDTIETYKNFEAAMSQVKAISGATEADFAKLTDKAKEMGATTKFTATESAEAFNYMAMAGWKTEDMLGGIEGILNLAAASGESLATTSDIVTDALTAFGMKANDAGHFSDVLAASSSNANTNVSLMGETFKYAGAMAGTLGYKIEDVALATGLMANAGIKGNMAGTALNSIFTRLSTNTNGAADALKELGIAFFNSDGSARPLLEVIKELRDATADFSDEQKANLGNTIAGTYAQKGFLAILNATTDDYNKLYEAVNNADGAAARMSEIMLDNLHGSITLLQSAVDGVKISFGERLSPYINNLADWLTAQMPAVERGLNQFMDWIDTRIDRLQRKFNGIADTKEWQDADFFAKVKIAWDEFITEPFLEWWNGTGKAKFAGFAQNIGTGIGSGLKAGIMTLLGIDLGETVDEGVSIGVSFAKGFLEGFDFKAVSGKLWQGFKGLTTSAFELLPGGEAAGLSSIMSAVLISKIAKSILGIGKGMAGIGRGVFGINPDTGVSLVGSFLGSAASGTGLLGKSGMLAINLGAGNLADGASMSAGALSMTGMAAGGGAIAAGATLVSSALDAYKAIKSDNKEESKAYGESAAWKAGGVVTGAATGAAIGSIIPGIGTAVGALVGAGVGGIAGWIKGNKIKEEYQENVEKMQKEAENAQKVFEATGLSIEDVTFKNEALIQAMNDSEVSASQFALMFQEECANVAKKAFGDISLSLAEVKKLASEITFADMAEELSEFAKVTADTEAALGSLKSSVSSLKKENWKVGLGMELSETDKDGYKKIIENFLNTSQTYINDNHYEATVALKLLVGEEVDTAGLDNYYGGLKSRLEEMGVQLAEAMNAALEDGLVTPEETARLEDLQNQIIRITNRLTESKTDAKMQALQIKYNGAALDINSFNVMQEELQAYVASASEQYEDALTVTLTNLNLQAAEAEFNYEKGLLTDEEYLRIQEDIQNQIDEATEGYYAQINELNIRVQSFNLNAIADAWATDLDGILPDMEGTLSEKLTKAMEKAITINPNVDSWTREDIMKWFDLSNLNTPAFENVYRELKMAAAMIPKQSKDEMIQRFQNSIPTVEELMEGVDWKALSWHDYSLLTGGDGTIWGNSTISAYDNVLAGIEGNVEEKIRVYAERIHEFMENCMDNEEIMAFMEQYMSETTSGFDFSNVMEQYGPISNEYYEQLVAEWQEAGTAYGDALNNGVSTSLLSGSYLLRTDLQTALNTATASPFTISPTINVTPNYNITAPTFPTISQGASGYAAGGYVSSGPQLSWLAEEGYGEFVIPTNPSRRARALDLYEQAGAALGVSAHADGGYVGGSILNDSASNYNLFADVNRNASVAYNESTEGNYSKETFEPVSAGETGIAGGTPVQVSVDVSPEVVIHVSEGQSEENIMQVIKRHIKEMADELGGEIAVKLEEVLSNMPLKRA